MAMNTQTAEAIEGLTLRFADLVHTDPQTRKAERWTDVQMWRIRRLRQFDEVLQSHGLTRRTVRWNSALQ